MKFLQFFIIFQSFFPLFSSSPILKALLKPLSICKSSKSCIEAVYESKRGSFQTNHLSSVAREEMEGLRMSVRRESETSPVAPGKINIERIDPIRIRETRSTEINAVAVDVNRLNIIVKNANGMPAADEKEIHQVHNHKLKTTNGNRNEEKQFSAKNIIFEKPNTNEPLTRAKETRGNRIESKHSDSGWGWFPSTNSLQSAEGNSVHGFLGKMGDLSTIRLSGLNHFVKDPMIDETFPENWQALQFLGEGSSGRTFLVRETNTREMLAVKIYGPEKQSTFNPELISREWEIINNPAVNLGNGPLQIVGKRYYLPMKYIQGVNWQVMMNNRMDRGSLKEDAKIAMAVLKELERLHFAGIVHNDAAIRNIIISKDLKPILVDFGSSIYSYSGKERLMDYSRFLRGIPDDLFFEIDSKSQVFEPKDLKEGVLSE